MTEPRPAAVVVISAGLSLVPYVGNALSTVYAAVDERRRDRIESTAREIAQAVGEERDEVHLGGCPGQCADSLLARLDHRGN